MARPAQGLRGQSQRLLETAPALGKPRHLVAAVARVSLATGPTGALGLERKFSGREFRSRQKGGDAVGKTKRGKGTKWMVVVDGQGVPLGSQLASASPAEVKLAEGTLQCISVPGRGPGRPRSRPLRVIADRGYDSDPLRWRLLQRGILLLSPHRQKRRRPCLNDGRIMRRYRKRWKVERTLAWLGNFRRLVVRYDRRLDMYRAFFHLACALITLRFLDK